MNGDNAIPKASLALWVVGILLAGLVVEYASESLAFLEPVGQILVALLGGLAALGAFATVYIAARRAFGLRHRVWLASVIAVWPMAYVYALLVQREDP